MEIELTKHEEDYIKSIFNLSILSNTDKVAVNQIADDLNVSSASVNGMLKKLKQKILVNYQKYGKVSLSEEGKSLATHLIRKHRLWETFLHNYLNFSWDEVHEIAEQLEHIKSPKLIEELDRFMQYPKQDPHGDFIPDENGNIPKHEFIPLSALPIKEEASVEMVNDSSPEFLKHLTDIELDLNCKLVILEKRTFDQSMKIFFKGKKEDVSRIFAENVYVKKL